MSRRRAKCSHEIHAGFTGHSLKQADQARRDQNTRCCGTNPPPVHHSGIEGFESFSGNETDLRKPAPKLASGKAAGFPITGGGRPGRSCRPARRAAHRFSCPVGRQGEPWRLFEKHPGCTNGNMAGLPDGFPGANTAKPAVRQRVPVTPWSVRSWNAAHPPPETERASPIIRNFMAMRIVFPSVLLITGVLVFNCAVSGPAATNTITVPAVAPVEVIPGSRQYSATNFQFSYSADTGLSHAVQRSTNLADWVSVSTNTAASNSVQFTDGIAPGSRFFYRIKLQPNP